MRSEKKQVIVAGQRRSERSALVLLFMLYPNRTGGLRTQGENGRHARGAEPLIYKPEQIVGPRCDNVHSQYVQKAPVGGKRQFGIDGQFPHLIATIEHRLLLNTR